MVEAKGVQADEIESVLSHKAETVAEIQAEELRLAEHVAKTFPNHEAALLLLGNVYRQHGNVAKSVSLYRQALAVNAQQPELYERLGQASHDKGQLDQALAYWQQGIDVDPNSPNLHRLMAETCMEQGKHEQALDLLIQACAVTPDTARHHYLLGQVYLQLKDYEQAKAQYARAIELAPIHYNTYFGLANAHMRSNERDKAIEYMNTYKALKQQYDESRDRNIHANEITTVRQRAAGFYLQAYNIYKKAGHAGKAENFIQRACDLDRDNALYLEILATHYYLDNRVLSALNTYKKALTIDPNQPLLFVNIGKLSAELGQYAQAQKVFETTVKHFPNYALAHAEFARLYLRAQKSPARALTLAHRAVELDPTAPNYMLLSWAHNAAGDSQAALTAIEKAVALDPGNEKYRGIYNQVKR